GTDPVVGDVVAILVEAGRGDDRHSRSLRHVDEALDVTANSQRHAVDHGATPGISHLPHLGDGGVGRVQQKVRLEDNWQSAGDEQAIVAVGWPELVCCEFTENRHHWHASQAFQQTTSECYETTSGLYSSA